jgi:hypothetical protein
MPRDLDLYPSIETKELKTIDVEFQATIGYKASSKPLVGLQNIEDKDKNVFLEFLNNL